MNTITIIKRHARWAKYFEDDTRPADRAKGFAVLPDGRAFVGRKAERKAKSAVLYFKLAVGAVRWDCGLNVIWTGCGLANEALQDVAAARERAQGENAPELVSRAKKRWFHRLAATRQQTAGKTVRLP